MDELIRLKAEAYDLIAVLETAQQRLRDVNQKILILSQSQPLKTEEAA